MHSTQKKALREAEKNEREQLKMIQHAEEMTALWAKFHEIGGKRKIHESMEVQFTFLHGAVCWYVCSTVLEWFSLGRVRDYGSRKTSQEAAPIRGRRRKQNKSYPKSKLIALLCVQH